MLSRRRQDLTAEMERLASSTAQLTESNRQLQERAATLAVDIDATGQAVAQLAEGETGATRGPVRAGRES